MADLKKGDEVGWSSSGGRFTGKVVRKITGEERVGNPGQKGAKIKGTKDDPRYEVASDKTGKHAAHRAEALKKK